MKTNHIIIGVIVFLILSLLLYSCCCGNTSNVAVKYYYSPGCPHCRNFMGAWNKFSSGGGAKFTKINCNETPELCSGISGVPHVTFESPTSSGVVVYPGERTAQGLTEFLNKFSSQ